MGFLVEHLDYVFFFYGLSFIILAVVSYLLYRKGNTLVPWELLALFGLLHGINEWLDMLKFTIGDFYGLFYIRLAFLLISFIFLFEFGRSGFRRFYPKMFGGLAIVWQYALMVVLLIVLHLKLLRNYEISVRYVFGFIGGMLAAFLFYKVYCTEKKARYYFLVTSVSIALYAIAAGLIVPRDEFILSVYMNDDFFKAKALFPIQLLRAALTVLICIVLWKYYAFTKRIQHNELIELKLGYGKWLTVAMISVIVCGWFLTSIIGQNVDRYQREDFKVGVTAVAAGIDIQKLKKLKDVPTDMDAAEYKMIRSHIQSFEKTMKGIKWFYLMKLRNGKVIFTIDSSPEEEPDFTKPGEEWKKTDKGGPPQILFDVFKRGEPVIYGPYDDKWGKWISAFIPIIDPETNKVHSVLGCDIYKQQWEQMLYLIRLQPIIITLLICIILIVAFLLHQSSLEASIIIAESENKYRNLFNSSNDSIMILDLEGKLLEVNKSACSRLGYPAEELRKLNYHEIETNDFEQLIPDRISLLKDHGNLVFESSYLTKDKMLVPVEVNASLVEYLGKPSILCIARDVSDRKKIEGILKDSELKYRLLFEEMMTGFALHEIICDEKGKPVDYRFLEVNPAYEKLTGLRASKIIGKTVLEILPETEPEWISDFGNVAITGKPRLIENFHKGLGKWYEVRAFSHEKGKFAVVFNEISERKFAEEMLLFERDVVTGMSQVSSLKDAGKRLLEVMCRIEGVDCGGVYDLNPGTGDLDLIAHYGLSEEFVKHVSHYGPETYQSKLVKEGKVLFDSYEKLIMHVEKCVEKEALKAIAIVPIRMENRTIAVVNVGSHKAEVFNEITRRKIMTLSDKIAPSLLKVRMAEDLRDANIFNREIISSAGEGIAVMDKDFKYLVWNHAMEKMSGISAADVLGKNALELFPVLVEQKVDTVLKKALAGETMTAPDFKLENRKTGKLIHTRAVCVPHKNAKGELSGVIAVISDITDRKSDEEKMRKLSIAVEQSPALIVITDTEGMIEYVNPKFESVTGYTFDDVRGRKMNILKSDQMPPEFYKEMWSTIKAGKEWRGQFHNKKKNGEYFWESATISPIYDDSGKITHYIAIKEDVTRQKDLQGQLLQAQKMESVGRLAGGIAHDFNNIIQVINGFAEFILLRMEKDDPNRTDIEEISKAGKRALGLTNQLLLFSRRKPVNMLEIDVNELVVNLQKMFQYVLGEDIAIENVLFPKLSRIKADASQLEQVLMNLVVNARDAMPKGGTLKFITSNIYLDEDDIESITEARPGKFVCISVADSGEGMTPEVLNQLFEPFFTTKPKGKGTGLGLSIVYGIVKQHNGWINVFSEPGKGSTFEIYMPAVAVAGEKAGPAVVKPKTETRKVLQRGRGERILLIEDENSVRNLTSRILKDNNYNVFAAADAVEAIQIFNAEHGAFDLVLSDVILPGQNGVLLVEELLRRKPGMKVLMASGYADERLKKTGIDDKGLKLLQKPYHYNELLTAVREVLGTAQKKES